MRHLTDIKVLNHKIIYFIKKTTKMGVARQIYMQKCLSNFFFVCLQVEAFYCHDFLTKIKARKLITQIVKHLTEIKVLNH